MDWLIPTVQNLAKPLPEHPSSHGPPRDSYLMNHAAGHTQHRRGWWHRRPPAAPASPRGTGVPPLLTSKQSAPLPSASKAVNKK